jgi:ligand-binding sensor domain-containing protein/signal transduction histidine kinase
MLQGLNANAVFVGNCRGRSQQGLWYGVQIGGLLVRKVIISIAALLCCTACSKSKQPNEKIVEKDSIVSPRITRLADLPVSLKPNVVFLKNMPKPVTVAVSGKIKYNHAALPTTKHIPTTHFALNTEPQGNANFTTFTTDDGLALDNIECGFKDKTGALWFGTAGGGVSRYNGHSFTTFSTVQGLAGNTVISIEEDKKGNLWFGTMGEGLVRYNGQSFTTFSKDQGIAGNSVGKIVEDKRGNLWFLIDGHVNRYDGQVFAPFTDSKVLVDYAVNTIKVDNKGNLWFGMRERGVLRYNGQSFTEFSTAHGLASNKVFSISEDKEGNIWFGTEKGVSCYNGNSFTTFSTEEGLVNNLVWSIAEDKKGNLWFGTNGGASRYDGRLFTTFSTEQGLANNRVLSITEDNAGNLWFGTDGGGVSRYNGQSFSNFSTKQGLADNIVWSIAEDKTGHLWFGTNNGVVSHYDRQLFTTYSTELGLINYRVYRITEDKKGNLWFGTDGGGVCRYNEQSSTTFSTAQGLVSNIVYDIKQDKAGSLWFGTDGGGVCRYNGQSFTTFSTQQGLAGNSILCIHEDKKDNMWFGTFNGLSRYDGQSFTTFSTEQGLANNIIWCIAEDKLGNLWFGTDDGVSLLKYNKVAEINRDKSYKTPLFENFTLADGLPDNGVTQLVEGDNGKMYLGTNLGICELVPSIHSKKGWVVGHVYNPKTGYPVKDVNSGQNTMFKDSRGIIWIATGSDKTALVRFDPRALTRDTTRAKLVIQQIKINDEPISWNSLLNRNEVGNPSTLTANTTAPNQVEEATIFGRLLSDEERTAMQLKFKHIQFSGVTKWYFLPENLVLPYVNNNISFSFNAIETSKNFLVEYQYMLAGYDNDWGPLSTQASANFTHLTEGTYTFKLKARTYEGVWAVPINYTFTVLPPWWRTWWMYAVYVGLTGLLFFGIIKVREQKLEAEKLILEETVALRTKQLDARNKIVGEQNNELQKLNGDLQKVNATKDKFFSIIGHDLKGPIHSLTAFSNLLIKHTDKMSKEEITLMAIDFDKTLKNVSLLLENLLNWSRSQSGDLKFTPEIFDLTESLKQNSELLRGQANNKNIRIERVHANKRIEVKAHKQSVDTIIRNLISNAIKFTLPEGSVTIGTYLRGNEVIVSVRDTGLGMNAEVIKKLFRPDIKHSVKGTANEKGTGLGLLLCKEFVEKNGGKIWVESAEGEGSLFQFTLMLAKVES